MTSLATTSRKTTSNSIITLNVGGTIFATTKQTLTGGCSIKNEEGQGGQLNYFHGLLNDKYSNLLDSQGHFFIDRDPTFFHYILNQLRDGTVFLPADNILIKQILQEAQFFSVQKLVEQIEFVLREQDAEHKSSKSSESQYTVVDVDSTSLKEVFMRHTGELGWKLLSVVPGSNGRNSLIFTKQLSNGQASLLTSLMNMANR